MKLYCFAAGLVLAAPAVAADDLSWRFAATANYDARDRGLSLSDFDAGGSFYADVETASGWFANAYVARADNQRFSDVQADITGGYSLFTKLADLSFSARITSFHGQGQSELFPEFQATAARDFGRAFTRIGVVAAPDGRWNAPDSASYYGFFDLDAPVPGLAALQIETSIGFDMREGRRDAFNWRAGASYNFDAISIGLHYQRSSLNQRATLDSGIDSSTNHGANYGDFGTRLGTARLTAQISFYF